VCVCACVTGGRGERKERGRGERREERAGDEREERWEAERGSRDGTGRGGIRRMKRIKKEGMNS
jgi:hypothetical protein